jgi:predicted nucleotidyltransferase
MTILKRRGNKPTMHEVRKIVSILQRSNPLRIILFGSLVRGIAHSESDIDLCVLVDSYGGRPSVRTKQDLYRLLAAQHYDFPVDIDVRVYEIAEYQDKLARGDPFVSDIAAGKVLYERG